MMKKVFLSVVILLGCVIAGLLWIVHDHQALAGIVRWSVARALPGVCVTKLEIGAQHFGGLQKIRLENVSCVARITGGILDIKAKGFEISGIRTLFSSTKALVVHVVGADIDFASGKGRGIIADFEIHFLDKGSTRMTGPVTVETLMWDKLKAGKTSFSLTGVGNALEFRDIRSEAYGGMISGMTRILLKPISYVADIRLDRLQTFRLAEFNEQISTQMAGRISGIVRVAGDAQRPTLIDADLQMPSGGKVNAALLSALTQYLPKSQERKRLDILIRNGGKLAVEVFSFTIKSNTPDHLSGMIKLASKEANIELNLTHDILTDGTWDGLAESWRAIFK